MSSEAFGACNSSEIRKRCQNYFTTRCVDSRGDIETGKRVFHSFFGFIFYNSSIGFIILKII